MVAFFLFPFSPTLIIQHTLLYLAGPHWGDEVSIILKHIEDLSDAAGISEHWDAGVWYGQVKSEVICGLQSHPLLEQHKDHYTVSKPWHPTCGIKQIYSNISNENTWTTDTWIYLWCMSSIWLWNDVGNIFQIYFRYYICPNVTSHLVSELLPSPLFLKWVKLELHWKHSWNAQDRAENRNTSPTVCSALIYITWHINLQLIPNYKILNLLRCYSFQITHGLKVKTFSAVNQSQWCTNPIFKIWIQCWYQSSGTWYYVILLSSHPIQHWKLHLSEISDVK